MKRFIPFVSKPARVSVVRLGGMIAAQGRGGAGLSDQALAPVLQKAFTKSKPSAVALVVNSPGGSPVQSSLIGSRIRRLADEHNVPVYAFVEDVAASGGYWLAAAADEIWIDPCSVVGSIGVISASFGAHELLARNGVERRVYTAGQSKSMLDPFRPENPDDVERLKSILSQIHGSFIDHVNDRRAGKLTTDTDLFTGEVWVGQKAVECGLVDGIGHIVPKMKERFGEKTKFQSFNRRKSVFSRLGARAFSDLSLTLEERALYAQYGL